MRQILLFGFVILLLLQSSLFSQGSSKLSVSLQKQISERKASSDYLVWVFFTDKGSNLEEKLILAEHNLTTKAKNRRLKDQSKKSLVDFYDIPVNPEYIRDISSHIIKFRHKSRWLNAISAQVNRRQLDEIQALPYVKKIDVVHFSKVPELEYSQVPDNYKNEANKGKYDLDYGASITQVEQINVPVVHDMGINGAGVLICMLDAGFNNLEHEALTHLNIIAQWDFVNNDGNVDDEGDMGTGNHGTNTLSTIAGFSEGNLIGPAYGADFILGKTENTEWERHIEEDAWVAGAEWADDLGADIISSSLGYRDGFTNGEANYTWEDMDGNTAIVTIGADIAASRGILVVNSAGNSGSASYPQNTLGAPSDGDSVLAVGAVYSNGSRTSFSSMGPSADGRMKPDVMAMGSGVVVASTYSTNGYSTSSGTSFSCPLTAGVAALVLQANPEATNMQVIEALHNTADRADNPDYEYGYGIISAYDAIYYFIPQITHQPLLDTENISGPFVVTTQIASIFPLLEDSLLVYYQYGESEWDSVTLVNQGDETFSAEIPGVTEDTEIHYYIKAVNSRGTSFHPLNAPEEYHSFFVGADIEAPVISHTPLNDFAYVRWPAKVSAIVSDNIGVDSVTVIFLVNGSEYVDYFDLTNTEGDLYEGEFNIDTTQIEIGDTIEYKIHAKDVSENVNVTYEPETGFFIFQIVNTKGIVLIVNDDTDKKTVIRSEKGTYERAAKSIGAAADDFQAILTDAGYIAEVVTMSEANSLEFSDYDLIVHSSGGNITTIDDEAYRTKLIAYVQDTSHKLLVEGGELGYDAASYPGYPAFATAVLHSNDWFGDESGTVNLNSTYTGHPILSNIYSLAQQITLSYIGFGDQDSQNQINGAYILYNTTDDVDGVGIGIYDPTPDDLTSAQIVYFAFNLNAVIGEDNKIALVENTAEYLLTPENTVSIDTPEDYHAATKYKLNANYPNPFNPSTNISFELAETQNVTLVVYNMIGQKVKTLVNGKKAAGNYKIQWNGKNEEGLQVSSGIYFLRLEAGKFKQTRKMLLVK